MLARGIVQKFRFGMPHFRQEELFEADGIKLARGTMARSPKKSALASAFSEEPPLPDEPPVSP